MTTLRKFKLNPLRIPLKITALFFKEGRVNCDSVGAEFREVIFDQVLNKRNQAHLMNILNSRINNAAH